MWISPTTDFSAFEMDEVYWFLNKKERTDSKANIFIMTMLSRKPRQIVAFAVDTSVNSQKIQGMVDSVPQAKCYYSDGCLIYQNVIYGGDYIRNPHNKADTHNIESSNADLRHYIAGLARRSRTFFRSKETLEAVLSVFIDAYNKYGEAKEKYRIPVKHKSNSKHLHEYRDCPFSILDFL